MFILALFAKTHTYLLPLFRERPILDLLSRAYNVLTSKARLAKSPHDALCSLPLIIGIVSNCIIHIGNSPPAIFPLILPHLPLRAEAEGGLRREKNPPSVRQIASGI